MSCSWELAASHPPSNKDVSTEAEESPLLAITKQRLTKADRDIARALVIYYMCRLVIALNYICSYKLYVFSKSNYQPKSISSHRHLTVFIYAGVKEYIDFQILTVIIG
jgi:hypothetical protein